MTNPRGRRPNPVEVEDLFLKVPAALKGHLRRLCSTGLYGKNPNEAAEHILSQEIRRLVASGEFDTLLARIPPAIESDAESSD